MTNEQLDALEVAAKKMIETSCGPFASFYNEDFSKLILDLIAELRQARAERDWLAKENRYAPCELGRKCLHPASSPKNKYHFCDSAECWLELAAKEAACLRI